MKKLHKWTLLLVSVIFLAACGNKGLENTVNYTVSDFTAVNQDGKEVTLKDFEGKVWVADFVFTNCKTVCPPMTANMAKLQSMINEEDLDVQLVSFSVDPEIDKPEILKEYGELFEADFSKWSFLTGYDQEFIAKFATKSFHTLAEKVKSGDDVLHGVKFYLVDQNGKVLKEYSGNVDTPYEEIISDIKTIL
ncbi:SCO family protein [Ferdinandcohnia quinoae]|uniref:SCO family protein n=1 Tax=Fredinandcohnia quinoae TaxID=2918902 RepID=A0AAW5E178_9BACI|nr:SCO family protein [Fredinandcohnia sp. SECRCQ15]MCH1626363.1 SCO family protein [Fredinandcohnia sp. SECRCQ15]